MKKLIITTVCCLLAQLFMPVNAQTWDITIAGGKGKCIIQTYDGEYVVGGGEQEGMGHLSPIYKLNYLGDTLFSFKNLVSEPHGGILSIVQTYDSNFIAVNHGNYFKLVKLDNNLNHIWTKTYGGGFSDYAHRANCIQRTKDSNYVIIGSYCDGSEYDYKRRVYIIKINNLGDTIWTKKYGELTVGVQGEYIIPTYDNGFMCAARIFDENYNTKYVWLLKLNSQGDSVWTKKYNYESQNEIWVNRIAFIEQTNDSNYLFGVRNDNWIMKINSIGDSIMKKTLNTSMRFFGQFKNDGYITGRGVYYRLDNNLDTKWSVDTGFMANDVVTLQDNGFVVVGSHYQNDRIRAAKLDSLGNGLDPIIIDDIRNKSYMQNNADVKLRPNPFKDKLYVTILSPEKKIQPGKISLYNSKGTLVYQKRLEGKNNYLLKTQHLNKGLYTCEIHYNDKVIIKKIIKQKM